MWFEGEGLGLLRFSVFEIKAGISLDVTLLEMEGFGSMGSTCSEVSGVVIWSGWIACIGFEGGRGTAHFEAEH